MNEETLQLRDIHLPEPISWWPLAPGWWVLLVLALLIIAVVFIAWKSYQSRQLKRDINAELELIKQQFQKTQDRSRLAKELSILLRRANISYYPGTNIAGLTGEEWLQHLDRTNTKQSSDISFMSSTGKVLLNAPYLPDEPDIEFDAASLISLCESWLLSAHQKAQVSPS